MRKDVFESYEGSEGPDHLAAHLSILIRALADKSIGYCRKKSMYS